MARAALHPGRVRAAVQSLSVLWDLTENADLVVNIGDYRLQDGTEPTSFRWRWALEWQIAVVASTAVQGAFRHW
ncbi:MAG: hypothetical protein DI630_00075 [Gordonia sp. (in: high G+C Gram-positive bacteria)]|nr:MAG: hypothetical protein DI630_00075 [Gordonia sp. (in: high G+C Gram-positive bacteria)]